MIETRDPEAAEERAQDGMRRAESGVTAIWKALFVDAVLDCALAHDEFTMDEVWDLVPKPPSGDPRATGPLMRKAARAGWIESTDRSRNSERGHGRNLRVWRSLVR